MSDDQFRRRDLGAWLGAEILIPVAVVLIVGLYLMLAE
jgi:hypothetical protein